MSWRVGVVALLVAVCAGCWSPDDLDLLARTNTYRAGIGLPAVTQDDYLHDTACQRAGQLVQAGSLAHDPTALRADLGGYGPWRWVGENLGVSGSTAAVQSALVLSPTHRAVLVDPRWRRAGICVLHYSGAVWVVERFTD